MKKKIVIANWKMSLTLRESIELAKGIVDGKPATEAVDVVLCPSFTALPSIHAVLHGGVALGAQDVFWEERGAYTGEISPQLLREQGCTFVIVGHSERRQHLGETDAMIQKKIAAVVSGGLVPILCVGETIEERRDGRKDTVVMQQVATAIQGLTLVGSAQLLIAYEPVWVIGTGQAVAPEDAAHMSQVILHTVRDVVSADKVASSVRVLYGGSVNAENIRTFTDLPGVHGVLVGGASLKTRSFLSLVEEVARST